MSCQVAQRLQARVGQRAAEAEGRHAPKQIAARGGRAVPGPPSHQWMGGSATVPCATFARYHGKARAVSLARRRRP